MKAVYAGTFDPFTEGHLDIVRRAARLFDHLTVAVAESSKKKTLFTAEERVKLASEEVKSFANVDVVSFRGLLSGFARENGIGVLVRGVRSGSDFAYEFQMTGVNARLAPGIDTVYLQTSPELQFVASSYVREIADLGGDLTGFVSPAVAEAVKQKMRQRG